MTAARSPARPRTLGPNGRALISPPKSIPSLFTFAELRAATGDVSKLIAPTGRDNLAAWHRPGESKPYVLAFDPGETTGFALVRPDGQTTHGVIEASRGRVDREYAREVSAVVCSALGIIEAAPGATRTPLIVAIEDVFVKDNVRSALVLAYYVGAIVSLAATYSVGSWLIPAARWQAPIIGRCVRDEGKRRSLACVQRFGLTAATHHESDAILLAMWARGPFGKPIRKFLA